MSTIPGITPNEAVEYADGTRLEVTTGEHFSVRDGHANSMGRFRTPDVIDPYRMSQARRKNPGWRMITSEEPDDDNCGCM